MSYIVKKANRVLTVPDEKVEEYQAMGYTIMDMSGNVVSEPAPTGKEAADKIEELQKENEELKATIQAQATMGEVASDAPDSGKKTTTKAAKKSE